MLIKKKKKETNTLTLFNNIYANSQIPAKNNKEIWNASRNHSVSVLAIIVLGG